MPQLLNANPLYVTLINAGVGAFIAVLILMGLYLIVRDLGRKFIDAQNRQAEAMGGVAQSMTSLTASVQTVLERDSREHQEILVTMRYIARRLEIKEEIPPHEC